MESNVKFTKLYIKTKARDKDRAAAIHFAIFCARLLGCPLVFGKFLTKNADAEIWSADELWIKNTILKISARYTF